MLVRNRMTPNPVSITPSTTIAEALEIMRENQIRRLPVIDKGKLVGIVTDRDLSEVSPSPATSLSIFELNYLLSKTRIKDILPRNMVVHTVAPDDLLEKAALLLREHQIGAVPVLEKDKLVGIITETNIFDAFIEMMGLNQVGTRLEISIRTDQAGELANIARLIADQGVNVSHIAVYRNGDAPVSLVIRIETLDSTPVVTALEKAGYPVKSVHRNWGEGSNNS